MCVPVTTKPFFNSVKFCKLQRVSLLYLLFIKEKISQYVRTGAKGIIPLAFQIPFQSFFKNIIELTDKYYLTTSGIFEFHYK